MNELHIYGLVEKKNGKFHGVIEARTSDGSKVQQFWSPAFETEEEVEARLVELVPVIHEALSKVGVVISKGEFDEAICV